MALFIVYLFIHSFNLGYYTKYTVTTSKRNKKAHLSLTNPHDAKACQKLLKF